MDKNNTFSDSFQVLWVEDNQNIITPFVERAEVAQIQLHTVSCWDEAKKELECDYEKWDGIILDAKCKFHKISDDNATEFLREALKDLAVYAKSKGRYIPWYVFTGCAQEEVDKLINVDRLIWDKDWQKRYYSKGEDDEELLKRVKLSAQTRPLNIVKAKYQDVLDALRECNLEEVEKEVENSLLALFMSQYELTECDDTIFKGLLAHIRIILEDICKSMGKKGILPTWIPRVDLTSSSKLLCGRSTKEYRIEDPILPEVLRTLMKNMVQSIPEPLHGKNEISERIKEHIKAANKKRPYLLDVYTFAICDIILWYRNYLLVHPDPVENRKNWQSI